ncbi:Ig-like domain-containing protein [Frigoriflavimonas asaccharolytica]|uniref:Ig-like domain-containing protein n=1 Tax=Frigoriflavimonas asaccharolytica TaxID=2735899 RepID=A0A8J8K932_9FLAO|nr:choice-of-anchor E domain-containing protein [Frigoriflavimonas asaccharolytica]NRS93181.1 hypothetical protein [Frigoriflavimonas asaccharolytica]
MKNKFSHNLKSYSSPSLVCYKGFLALLVFAIGLFSTISIKGQSNNNTPISSYYSIVGDYDYEVIGNSELTETGASNNCGTDAASSRTLSIPSGATIVKAYVHWYGMTRYENVGLNTYMPLGNISFKAPGASAVNLNATARPAYSSVNGSAVNYESKKVDVTSELQALANPNGTYTVDINGAYPSACALQQGNARAWTLTVVYTTTPGVSQKIYLYDGLVSIYQITSTTNVSGYAVPNSGSTAGTLTAVFLQGDPGLAGESCTISDPSFPSFPNDFGNSSSGSALDIDILTGNFTPGSTSMNIVTTTLQDLVIEAEYALKIPCPAPVIDIQPAANQTVCNPAPAIPLTIVASGAGTLTYQWFRNTVNSNTTGTAISGATSSTYTPPNSVNGTLYYYAQVTGACGSPTTSAISVVTVNKTTITGQPTPTQTVCQNDAPTNLSVTAVGPGLTYQWYRNTTNSTTGGTLITGATAATYTPSTATAGTLYYYAVVTGTCNSATSNTATVIVNAATVIVSASPATQTLCRNATPTNLSITATGTGTLSYALYRNTTNSTTGGTLIGTSSASTYTPPTNVVGTIYYYVIVTGTCGTATSGVSAVNVTASTAISAQPQSIQTICKDNIPVNLSVTASGTGTLSYQWYSNTINTATGGMLISGATTATYTPSTSAVGTKYYYSIVSGTCGSVTSTVSTVIVTSCISTAATCSNNGTFENSADDYMFFQIDPAQPSGATTYNVTATFGGNPATITLMNNSAATNINYGYGTYLKVLNGSLGSGDFTIIITPNNGGAAQNLTITNTGTCSTICLSNSTGNTITQYFYSPFSLTEINGSAIIPKFDEGASRKLTAVKVDYGITFNGDVDITNTNAASVTARFSQASDLTFDFAGFSAPVSQFVSIQNPTYPASQTFASGTTTFPFNTTYSSSNTYTSTANLANFIGVGSVPSSVTTFTGITIQGGGGTLNSLSKTKASYFYKVEYTYDCLLVCYNDANKTAAGVDTKHGITLLQKAGADSGNWPMIRKSGFTALESNTKGFVITRATTTQISNIVSPQEGMMVYDTVAKCLKLYDGSNWSCFVTPTCP